MLPIPKFYNSTDTTEYTTVYDFGNVDAGAYKPDSTGLEIHLWNDKEIAGSDDMTSVRLSVRDADGNEDKVWTKQCWVEVKSNGGTATVDDAMTTFAKVGLNHELTLGDIQSGKYRRLYIRVHAPTDAVEGDITFQLRVKYQDSATDLTEVIEQHFQDLRAADDDYVHAAITGTGATQEITTAITNPDVGRNISIKTTNVGAPSGVVIITGVNAQGASTTENITIVAGSTVYGNVAFVTISKITIPAGVSASDTVTVGISDKLGLNLPIDNVANVFKKKKGNLDASSEITNKVNTIYGTLDCATIIVNEDITIWYIGRA